MLLQPATVADDRAIVALANRAYRAVGPVRSWTHEAFLAGDRITLALLQAEREAAPDAHLLVWRDPAGIACGSVRLVPGSDGVWHLGLLAIDPALQDRGRGRALLAAAEDYARARAARRMALTVINLRDSLIGWYERRGYIRTGETSPFPYGDDRFGRPLRDDLAFVALEKPL